VTQEQFMDTISGAFRHHLEKQDGRLERFRIFEETRGLVMVVYFKENNPNLPHDIPAERKQGMIEHSPAVDAILDMEEAEQKRNEALIHDLMRSISG
jgi:hypothetical protein